MATDAEKLLESKITLSILKRQPHRVLLDLAKHYKLKGASKLAREFLIARLAEIVDSPEGAEIRKDQFKAAIQPEENEMGIIPDVQDPAEVQAVIDAQENWVPAKPPLSDKRPGMEDTMIVSTINGDIEELTQSFVDQLAAPKKEKSAKSAKPKSVKAPAGKFVSDGVIADRMKQAGIKTPQALLVARAADTFDEPFDLAELADKAIELGLRTRQDPLYIVKYYLGKLLEGGLAEAS